MRSRRTWPALLLAFVAGACASSEIGPVPPCNEIELVERSSDVPLVLIVNDTMRRDRVGIYGGSANTPNFDAFARENLYFERAYTQAPWTKPAMATLFTSLYPSQHGLLSIAAPLSKLDVLGDDFVTLAEVLSSAGYRTAAFVTNPWMDGKFGFAQGFDLYGDSLADWGAGGERVGQAALSWLERVPPGQKYFLYVHYIDSHDPYGMLDDADVDANLDRMKNDPRPVGGDAKLVYEKLLARKEQIFSPESREKLLAIGPTRTFFDLVYDRGVEDFDRALGEFLAGFSGHPSSERAAIVIASDHGEALYERGYGNHGRGLFDDEAAIPLAMRLPGVAPRAPSVDCLVGLIDLMPTLCDYLGVACPEPVFGRSFIGRGNDRDRGYMVTEGVVARPQHRSIRNGNYTLIWEPNGSLSGRPRAHALFYTSDDPGEQRDLLSDEHRTPEFVRMAQSLDAALTAAVPDFDAPERELIPLDPEIGERLRALGYLD